MTTDPTLSRGRPRQLAAWTLVSGALTLLVACGGPEPPAANDIMLSVDGAVERVWKVHDLMRGRVDWQSADGTFFPAVPLEYALTAGDGLAMERLQSVRIVGQHGALELAGEDLPLVHQLLLKVDLERGGTWQLVGRSRSIERRLEAQIPRGRLNRIDRIEITLTGAAGSAPPAAP